MGAIPTCTEQNLTPASGDREHLGSNHFAGIEISMLILVLWILKKIKNKINTLSETLKFLCFYLMEMKNSIATRMLRGEEVRISKKNHHIFQWGKK